MSSLQLDWSSFQGLGMMTTVTLPVYNTSADSVSAQKQPFPCITFVLFNHAQTLKQNVFVSVEPNHSRSNGIWRHSEGAGVTHSSWEGDVTLLLCLPNFTVPTVIVQLGPLGYAFSLNRNGFVLFHPNLQAVHGRLHNPPNADLLDVEVENEDKIEVHVHFESIVWDV